MWARSLPLHIHLTADIHLDPCTPHDASLGLCIPKVQEHFFLETDILLTTSDIWFLTISKNQRSIESLCWKGLWWAHQMKALGLFTGDVLD